MKNVFQAISPKRTADGVGLYPTIPSWYPNRLIRRAVKQGREFRLPAPYRKFLLLNPDLRKQIIKLAY